jgi:hypothetical protein
MHHQLVCSTSTALLMGKRSEHSEADLPFLPFAMLSSSATLTDILQSSAFFYYERPNN